MPSDHRAHGLAQSNTTEQHATAQRLLLGQRIDINAADAAAFEVLTGIGPALAQRIIEDRDLNGPFASVGDLTRVYGIGPSTIKKNRFYLTIAL